MVEHAPPKLVQASRLRSIPSRTTT